MIVVAGLLPLLAMASAPADAPDDLVPGVRIGTVRLGAGFAALEKIGASTKSRAVYGGTWETWVAAGSRLDVFSEDLSTNDNPGSARIIRHTSPRFVTAGPRGVGAGASEVQMRRAFPRARSIGTYKPVWGGTPVRVFDDRRGGLTYEVSRGKCIAVAIHPKGVALDSRSSFYRQHLALSIYK